MKTLIKNIILSDFNKAKARAKAKASYKHKAGKQQYNDRSWISEVRGAV